MFKKYPFQESIPFSLLFEVQNGNHIAKSQSQKQYLDETSLFGKFLVLESE
jgi:hypothetical protein